NRTIGIDDHVAGSVCWRRKTHIGQIGLGRQVTNRGVQRHFVVVASKVGIDLRLAIAKRIDRETKTRSPVVDEGVTRNGSLHPVLLPTQAKVHGHVTVQVPRVINVTGDVAARAVGIAFSELATVLLQIDLASNAVCRGVQGADVATSASNAQTERSV